MDGERVVGVIALARTKTGMFSSKAYTLVFTTHRLLLAEMTKAATVAEVERSRARAKEGGSGFFGQWGAQLKSSTSFGQHYLSWDPEAVLAETPGNVAVSPAEIRSVTVDRKTRSQGVSDDADFVPYLRVTVETGGWKRTFDTDAEHPSRDEARAMVTALLGR